MVTSRQKVHRSDSNYLLPSSSTTARDGSSICRLYKTIKAHAIFTGHVEPSEEQNFLPEKEESNRYKKTANYVMKKRHKLSLHGNFHFK